MPVTRLAETPSQTAGPYVHIGAMPQVVGLPAQGRAPPSVVLAKGAPLTIFGLIFDGANAPLTDAMVELWQADGNGQHDWQGYRGWGRSATDRQTGEWRFCTVRPGPTPYASGIMQAPHLNLLIFARGINIHLHTRVYFPEDAATHATDPALCLIEQPNRRQSLIAAQQADGIYRFDIWLQGANETVFFDV